MYISSNITKDRSAINWINMHLTKQKKQVEIKEGDFGAREV